MLTFVGEETETGILPINDFLSLVTTDLFKAIESGEKLVVGTKKKVKYYNIPAAFDIETSSFYINNTKYAIMYHWQFGIGSHVTAGRTWDSFVSTMNAVSTIFNTVDQNAPKLIVYVHNLPYEFQWMRRHFKWDKLFIMDDRKPVYARTTTGIEFRCSLKLSGKSLAKTAEDLTKFSVTKMVGDLDYNLIRHPNTPLTPEELKYCENDIRVLLAYIQEKIWHDGDISKIPLTNTGYVRRYCRDACFRETMEKDEQSNADVNLDAIGISRNERLLSRRIYAR